MGLPITATDLTVGYGPDHGNSPVLDEVSFEIEENEFIVILGPSGCGKTTLLKTLAGTCPLTHGHVTVGDEPLKGPDSRVSMVFQEFGLLPWKTVRENVTVALKVQEGIDAPARRTRAAEWLENVGLTDVDDKYPAELSGGMKQRVGLARAFAVDPEILLLDEPFGSLDAQTKDRMQLRLLQLWHGHKTVIYVTHDIHEAIFLADRILVLSESPTSIRSQIPIEFDRPRWDRRLEIEDSEEFSALKSELRETIGLTVH